MLVSTVPDYPVDHEHPNFKYYWPLHHACVRIFKEVCKSRAKGCKPGAKDRHVHYISSLQKVWTKLAEVETKSACWSNINIEWSWTDDYDGSEDRDSYNIFETEEEEVYKADPVKVPKFTNEVLLRLKPLRVLGSRLQPVVGISAKRRLLLLPPELVELILSHLQELQHFPLECTHILAPHYWRRLLFEKHIVSWIWDLDHKAIQRKETLNKGVNWDWELLVQQLTRMDALQEGNVLEDAPPGLRNRLRIWDRIIELKFDEEVDYEKLKT